jgi:Family of unknown function (DUF5681)
MSETTTQTDRDERGRFQPGNTGNGGGRPRGSRNKLGEAFLEDLRDSWNEVGAIALKRCAQEDPAAYCRIVAGLLPRDFNINLAVDVADFSTRFQTALAMLGNTPAPRQIRKPLPGQPRTIEHDDVG